tara:strand:- start:9333 stop:10508 length:1176 start_codon:yes stop_codon:yes gene_type:complete
MLTSYLCGPAIIYIGFSLIQILIDIYKEIYNAAFIKFIAMLVMALIINILCDMGLTVLAWFFVFIPIIMMTIVSTLLLQTFGTSPDTNYMSSKVKDVSNNYYIDDNILHTKRKNSTLQTSSTIDVSNRIDRDKERNKFYDDIEKVYDLSSSQVDTYDLSNNLKKYFVAHNLLNDFNNSFLITNIKKFLNIFSNRSQYAIDGNGNFINNSSPYINNTINPLYGYSNTNAPHTSSIPMDLNKELKSNLRVDNMYGSDFESYDKKYNNEFRMDGYAIFDQQQRNSMQNKLPNYSKEQIDKKIEEKWQKLSGAQQDAYNREAQGKIHESSYDPNNFSSYRLPLSNLFKDNTKKTTDDLRLEACPPGKIKNSRGSCVRPCKIGYERKYVNGYCEPI